jgi:NtrC-family two-component system sensor histidine kinase KinB
MAAVIYSAIWSLHGVQVTFSRGRIGNARAARGAEFIDNALGEQRTTLWLLLSGAQHEAALTSAASWQEYENGVKLEDSPGVDDSVLAIDAQLSQQVAEYKNLSQKVLAANELTLQPSTQVVVRETLEPKIANMRALAQQMVSAANIAALQDADQARSAFDGTIRRSAWVTLVGIFLALVMGVRLVRTAVFPLKQLVNQAERIAEGDLTPQPRIDRQDEVGALSRAIELMTDRIREARKLALKRLQRAEQMSDAALEHLYDPVIVLDQKSRIVHLNQAGEDLLGKMPDGVKIPIGEHIKDRRLARALTKVAMSHTLAAPEEESETLLLPLDGVKRVYRFRATPMKDDEGTILGSVVVLEDVTHFREVDRLKNEFIGVASHELRTPVNSLLLSAQLLKDGAVGELTPEQTEIVDMQLQDLDRLEKLMRDLLDVTKLAAGMTPPRLQPTRVSDLVGSTVQSMKSAAGKQSVELYAVLDGDLGSVQVDRSQIGRVLTNLIANAIRHTGKLGIVKVGAYLADNEVTFYVEDTGEGIPQDYLARIFDRFVQVPGATQGGAGLGLSIAQNIVKAHLGSMGVESEVGKGSVFHFTLPRMLESPGRGKTT